MTVIKQKMFDPKTPPLEDKTWERLPLGPHTFIVRKAEIKTSEESVQPPKRRVLLDVEIIDSEDPSAIGKKGRDTFFLTHPTDTKPYTEQLWVSIAKIAPRAVTPEGVDDEKLPGLVYKATVVANGEYHNPKYPYPLRYEMPKMPEAGGTADAGPVDTGSSDVPF